MTKELNILTHVLVPKHEILAKEQEEQLLQSYNISKKQLPKIPIKDPAIQHLNAKGGDIIKVTRQSETATRSAFYRVVVE